MAAELTKLRTTFVDRVSKEIVNQLLDNLLEDKVLNSGEQDAIVEEYKTTTDRARKLIDTVRKKGDKASNRLIHHLQNRDATLYEDLCQTCGLAAKPAVQETPIPQKSVEQQESWEQPDGPAILKKRNNRDIYPVTLNSVKNRVALLITNITFADKEYNRNGAEKDEENMDNLLSNLGYEVVKYTNLTAKQMNDALVKFSEHPKLKETDSVFVVIMSHGKLGSVLGVNFKPDCSPGEKSDELPVDNIYRHLNAANCPALVNKPKIIIIQACRGDQKGGVYMCDDVETDEFAKGDIEEDALRCIHKEKDFIAFLSSTPDTVSYRTKSQGSFLIQFTVQVFKDYAKQDGIEELFRKVMRKFEEEEEIPSRIKQMATKDRCTLTRHFYLFLEEPNST
uniref:Caspase-1 n=1 Tax=Neogobius melanostomus TaxID=47308 RepID=A0A8C6T1V8_9GOBI